MFNYFCWFGSLEDFFGWYYNLLVLMIYVSDVSLWMCLLDLVVGLVCWLLLLCEVLFCFGLVVVVSKFVYWVVVMVLLIVWMLFNNGLWLEGIIVFGLLVIYVLIEWFMWYSWFILVVLVVVIVVFILGV